MPLSRSSGDFSVTADKPISVVQYMSSHDTGGAGTGDPVMAQAVPIEQFRPNYVVLVPSNWINDFLVVTKPADVVATLDGIALDEAVFVPVGDQNDPTPWVGRIAASDGVHTLAGRAELQRDRGHDQYDSYAYPVGLNQQSATRSDQVAQKV